ncbi:hypothetical protein [Ruegeria atlantica]|uniref:hypothetical protein n=1 Tax=Ruegeria atlantica TaxID=81569 RepID=UPI00147C2600|nr:hypothetical protein [Ruegeria atlantica]
MSGVFGVCRVLKLAACLSVIGTLLHAEASCDAPCQIARKAQDPLASIRALVLDSTVAFDNERDPLSYATQVQPVYSVPADGSFNVILRGTVPILGVRNGVVLPPLGPDARGGSSYGWGISDTVIQAFFSPKTDGDLKFGIGPQISLPTHTRDELAGPGWGVGLAGVITGFKGRWSYAAIVGQHWGEDGFSVTSINPVLMFNSDLLGGMYFGYANTITHDWQSATSDAWQVPLGLTMGKTFARGNGSAVDVNFGFYRMGKRPVGGAESQLKIALTTIWP